MAWLFAVNTLNPEAMPEKWKFGVCLTFLIAAAFLAGAHQKIYQPVQAPLWVYFTGVGVAAYCLSRLWDFYQPSQPDEF